MAFEQVRIRLADGQEFGPVAWSEMLRWRQEGRVPDTAFLIDQASGEVQAVAAFPDLRQIQAAPAAPTYQPPSPGYQAQTPGYAAPVTPVYAQLVPPTPVPMGGAGPWGMPQNNTPPDAYCGTVFTYGSNALRDYWGLAIGGYLIYFLMVFVISFFADKFAEAISVPFINTIITGFIIPPFIGGAIRFGLNIYRRENPQIGDLFSGFSEYPKWLGIYWLLAVITFLCYIPAIIMAFPIIISAMSHAFSPHMLMDDLQSFFIIILATTVLVMAVMTRFCFTYLLGADGHGVIDALTTSNRMVNGRFFYVLGMNVLLGLILFIGLLLCLIVTCFSAPLCLIMALVGSLFTVPLCSAVFIALYAAIRGVENIPPPPR